MIRKPLTSSARSAHKEKRHGALTTAVLTCVYLTSACDQTRLDENLCPLNETPTRSTVLLLDTSDPLTPEHREVLNRLVREMQEPQGPSDFYIAPGEALIVYELGENLGEMVPELTVCNPGGHPDTWSWRRNLTEGKALALRQWQRFRETVDLLFDEPLESAPQSRSPIIETLSVIAARHAPSRRSTSGLRTHVIVYSDLLQHTDALSHYGIYPPAEQVPQHLRTDLAGVEVSLYRLERERYAQWQTTDHYYWWSYLIMTFGGQVIWQESV